MTTLGIDVSHHQGRVDWHALSRSQFHFAFIKASEGTNIDPLFADNWSGSRDAGLLHGAYHFARPDGAPEAQAAHFAAVVGPAAWGELPPVLDLEVTGNLSPDGVVRWALAFIKKADALFGRPIMLYTGGLWRHQLGDPLVPELSERLLWTTRYSVREPILPKNWGKWDFWQFTDGQNGEVMTVPGVRGRCDIDRFRGDLSELLALQYTAEPARPSAVPELPAWSGQHFVWPRTPPVRGDDVRTFQAQLHGLGLNLSVDGVYGPESKVACVAFQRYAGLTPDGIVGPRTWNAAFDPKASDLHCP